VGILWVEWPRKLSRTGFGISCVERYGSVAIMLYLIESLL
jgi:hypothetical protein